MKKEMITIIGGGASGLVAAIFAKRNGADVTILERNNRIARKILATGNGRCNYTNVTANGLDYNNPDFVGYGLSHFSPQKAIAFFEELGIEPKIEGQGKAYPLSEQASSIVDVFLYELERLEIPVVSDAFVTRILRKQNGFVLILEDGRQFDTDKVILSTGGNSMPKSGSDGSGYDLAKNLGHHVTEVFPSIVKLKLDSPYLRHLEGIKMPTHLELLVGEEVIQTEYNDIIFGNYGISGPATLDISRKALELYRAGENPYLKLTLVTALDRRQVEERFLKLQDKPTDQSLVGLIHKRYISAIIKEAGIEKQNTLFKDLSKSEQVKLTDLLFNWRFKITGSKSFHDAQATAGGVDLKEIDSQTMESKRIPGLYITGEVMDIDGRCGGYNLQWAWTSGALAGTHAATGKAYDQNQ
ncbi:MAG: NAD(P)/FAD-dependent oxidoreductase [Bacilli bacterium]|nr:NAD(P)/FAD-dependent oxidoreductase [Bacilli bacterium]MBN2877697.1 NAD(P)/FAD-dependent oxidoreductase [Bacilli bacterium]